MHKLEADRQVGATEPITESTADETPTGICPECGTEFFCQESTCEACDCGIEETDEC